MHAEIWKKIQGFEYHEVSNLGRVRSLDRYARGVSKTGGEHKRLVAGKMLTLSRHTHGYQTVVLSNNGARAFLVHRLVAASFLSNPNALAEVNHKDLDKTNNSADNLEWCTRKQNQQHAARAGRFDKVRGEQRKTAKLTDSKVREIRDLISRGMKNTEIAKIFGVSTAPISYIRTGKAWVHVQ